MKKYYTNSELERYNSNELFKFIKLKFSFEKNVRI